jgi:hypothetical protein
MSLSLIGSNQRLYHQGKSLWLDPIRLKLTFYHTQVKSLWLDPIRLKLTFSHTQGKSLWLDPIRLKLMFYHTQGKSLWLDPIRLKLMFYHTQDKSLWLDPIRTLTIIPQMQLPEIEKRFFLNNVYLHTCVFFIFYLKLRNSTKISIVFGFLCVNFLFFCM